MEEIPVEQGRPGAAGLLALGLVSREQERLGLGGHAPNHLPIGEHMDHVRSIDRAQPRDDLLLGVIRSLLEDQHLRMVINREGLFGKLVVDLQAAQVRVGLENRFQIKPKLSLEHARFRDAVAPQDVFSRVGIRSGRGNRRSSAGSARGPGWSFPTAGSR